MAASMQSEKGPDKDPASAPPQKRKLACIECRRRKQKCDYGMPCIHCAKRFPQPACKYPTRNKRAARSTTNETSEKQVLEDAFHDEPYSHLDLDGVKHVIAQIDKRRIYPGDADDASLTFSGPSSRDDQLTKASSSGPQNVDEVLRVAIRLATSRESTKVVIDSKTMLNALAALMPHRDATTPIDERSLLFPSRSAPFGVPKPVDGDFSSLPLKLTTMDKELVRTHLQFLSRFKVSVDGCPDPENRFMRHWLPFCLSDPLLLQIIMFTSSCFLNEWGNVSQEIVLMHKHRVYRRLNAALASPDAQSSDTTIMALEQIVVDSWLWSGSKDLQAHLKGLRTMIQMRGGFQKLGMQGFLSKMIIINDICLGITHEIDPFMYGQPGFGFTDPFMIPLQRAYNSPLLFEAPSFADPTSSLQLHPSTAKILDGMRSLLRTILTLPNTPTKVQLRDAHAKATLAYQQLCEMPEDVFSTAHPGSPEKPTSPDDAASEEDRSTGSSPPASEKRSPQSSTDEQTSTTSLNDSIASAQSPDLVYRVVRMTSSIYCRAILRRTPTSNVCDVNEFMSIWYPMWQYSMAGWNKIIGIFIWALVAIVPSCHEAPRMRFLESIMVGGFLSIAVENWHVGIEAADTAVRIQRWLRGGGRAVGQSSSRGGFAGKPPRLGDR